jgi:hypothetical protein
MKKGFFCLLVVLTIACNNQEKKTGTDVFIPAIDSLLITDSSWGLITSTADFELLEKQYGDNNIKDERICDAECMDSINVTKLYPGTTNEATIYWNVNAYHKTINMIECFNDSASWHTSEGIKIGSPFADLLKLNQQKITFSGFGWDYGGNINSYNGGKLENSNIYYKLNLSDYTNNDSLLGDIELHTDMPAVQKAMEKIQVYWLTLSFQK